MPRFHRSHSVVKIRLTDALKGETDFACLQVIAQLGTTVVSLRKGIFYALWKASFDICPIDFLQCPSMLGPVPLILPPIASKRFP